ncbi:hypothetical protein MHU86_14123 [Fragilaria crotonensis]|nr:hypothetical protein MHU86_14123 [Fragilaria crotonensis]
MKVGAYLLLHEQATEQHCLPPPPQPQHQVHMSLPNRLEDEASGSSPSSLPGLRKRTMTQFLSGFLMVALLGCLVVFMSQTEEDSLIAHETTSGVQTKQIPVMTGKCTGLCSARLDQRKEIHGGDLMSNADLLRLVQNSRDEVVGDLKSKYGGSEMFSSIFESTPGTLRQSFVTPDKNGVSVKRFQRKLQMKVLEVQASISLENTKLFKGCDCNGETIETRRLPSSQQTDSLPVERFMSSFVWSTAGHSAAAGHGNLHNESYTAFLEHVAKPVFDAIGIEFQGRNYAMGGMKSAPLLALCNEAIFGTDADVLSWDFGMTDGRDFHKKAVFANRAGVHRNRPAIVDMNVFGHIWPERTEELKVVERYGLTTFHIKEGSDELMMKSVPDMFGLSQEQIDATPEYIRYVKCNGVLEKGDPGCASNKWNPICPQRLHKTSWHPGWRVQAMFGFAIALFLIDALTQAIEGLGPNDYDPKQKLQELKDEEDRTYKQFFESIVEGDRVKDFINDTIASGIDPQMFFREPNICRTTILPSESRYRGYFSGVRTRLNGDYEKGISRDIIDNEPADGRLRIALESKERQEWCQWSSRLISRITFMPTQMVDGFT